MRVLLAISVLKLGHKGECLTMYLRWSLCTYYVLCSHQVRVTAGSLGLCSCAVWCLFSANQLLCLLILMLGRFGLFGPLLIFRLVSGSCVLEVVLCFYGLILFFFFFSCVEFWSYVSVTFSWDFFHLLSGEGMFLWLSHSVFLSVE